MVYVKISRRNCRNYAWNAVAFLNEKFHYKSIAPLSLTSWCVAPWYQDHMITIASIHWLNVSRTLYPFANVMVERCLKSALVPFLFFGPWLRRTKPASPGCFPSPAPVLWTLLLPLAWVNCNSGIRQQSTVSTILHQWFFCGNSQLSTWKW